MIPRVAAIAAALSSRRLDSVVGWIGLWLAAASVIGCHGAASPEGDHETEHEAEHHRPPHQPVDFVAAVQRLEELHEEFRDGPPRPADVLPLETELADILRWLPRMAADTDLPEAAWNRVQRAAAEASTVVQSVHAQPANQRRAAYREQAAAMAKWLEELAAVALESLKSTEEIAGIGAAT